jgi:hypothetical protein
MTSSLPQRADKPEHVEVPARGTPSVRRNARIWTSDDFVGLKRRGIALSASDAFCMTSRSSLVPGVCRSIRMVFSGMVLSSGFQPRFFRFDE